MRQHAIRRSHRAAAALLAVGLVAGAGQAAVSRTTIRKGETLSQIARRYHVSVADLARWNGISDPNRIVTGRTLLLSGPAATGTPSSSTSKGSQGSKGASNGPLDAWGQPVLASPMVIAKGGVVRHLVKPGESWARIAKGAGTTTAVVLTMNHLKAGAPLIAGSRVLVPGPHWICPVPNASKSFANTWGAPRPGGRRHLGTDIFAPSGTLVSAPVGGMIRLYPNTLGGLALYLDGDDGNTYYMAHFVQVLVAQGQRVEPGQAIGKVGRTGDAATTPAHLHLELKPGGGPTINSYFTVKAWCS